MTIGNRLKEELRTLAIYTALFGAWFLTFLVMKDLILTEYAIEPVGVTTALVAALVLAKAVLLLEHVDLGAWSHRKPAWIEVALRTLLYAAGALLMLLLEKAFEARHEAGGFLNALAGVLQHRDIPHVLANAICATVALLLFNMNSVIRRHLGAGTVIRMFRQPLPQAEHADRS